MAPKITRSFKLPDFAHASRLFGRTQHRAPSYSSRLTILAAFSLCLSLGSSKAFSETLTPHQAATAQDQLVALCYPSGAQVQDTAMNPSRYLGDKTPLAAARLFPSVARYFNEAGLVGKICDSIIRVNSELMTSYISYGPSAGSEVKRRPLVSAMVEKSLDIISPQISLKTFLAASRAKPVDSDKSDKNKKNDKVRNPDPTEAPNQSTSVSYTDRRLRPLSPDADADTEASRRYAVSGAKKLPLNGLIATSFEKADLEILFGPLIAMGSGSILDGDSFVQAWHVSKRAIVSTSVGVGEISRCLSARINEKLTQSGGDSWGLEYPIPRFPPTRPVFELAARSQHDYLLRLRGFLVELARTIAKDPKEAEQMRTWIDAVAFGKFTGVGAPSVAPCSRKQGQYDQWMASHRMDERLAKLTGSDLAAASRTCDDSPFVKGSQSLPAVGDDDVQRLKQAEGKGPTKDENGAPLKAEQASTDGGSSVKDEASSGMSEALRLGAVGIEQLMVVRFNDWTSGRYGFGTGRKPYMQTETLGRESVEEMSHLAAGKLALAKDQLSSLVHGIGGERLAPAKEASMKAQKKAGVLTAGRAGSAASNAAPTASQGGDGWKGQVTNETTSGEGSGQAGQGLGQTAAPVNSEEGLRLFAADWTPPSIPCDGFLEGVMGVACSEKSDDAAAESVAAAPLLSPDQFISQAMNRLRQASESYATLYLVLAQEDLSAGAFRNRMDADYTCGALLQGMDELTLRRHRDSAEFALVMDANDLALALERLHRGQELMDLAIGDRDFMQMFNFAQKTKKAAGLEDTRRTHTYLREGESGKGKTK